MSRHKGNDTPPLEVRILDRVGIVDNDDGEACWLWTGNVNRQTGYGQFTVWEDGERGTTTTGHKLMYLVAYGPNSIPAGYYVCHWCNIRICCNPNHLYVDTNQGNMRYASECGALANQVRGSNNPKSKLTDEDVLDIRSRVVAGELVVHIAKDYPSITTRSLYDVVNLKSWTHVVVNGYAPPVPTEYGKRHVKLTEDDIRTIRTRLRNGESDSSIAVDYPVGEVTIARIRKGQVWSHIQ